MSEKKYYGKLLLFGEYTTLIGGKALAMPLKAYYGQWRFHPEQLEYRDLLLDFFNYVSDLEHIEVDEKAFLTDYAAGLNFDFNIPVGYGLGSSGAITSAFYDHYVIKKTTELAELKQILGRIESFFHGKSSGMDPIVSYINYPIINHGNDELEILMHEIDFDALSYELIDTGISRRTQPLVESFLKRIENESHYREAMEALSELNNRAIDALLANKMDVFQAIVNQLSALQFEHMQDMIIDDVRADWMNSLKDASRAYKLCGAGGGGCYLAFNF